MRGFKRWDDEVAMHGVNSTLSNLNFRLRRAGEDVKNLREVRQYLQRRYAPELGGTLDSVADELDRVAVAIEDKSAELSDLRELQIRLESRHGDLFDQALWELRLLDLCLTPVRRYLRRELDEVLF